MLKSFMKWVCSAVQRKWQTFRYGPWYDFCWFAVAFCVACGANMAARHADIARWIPVDVPYLWVWGLLVACGVLLLSGRRRWGAYALAFIGIGMGICYLPRFAAFLSKLPFELGVAAVVLALLGLRRVCRFGSQIFPREEVPEPRVPDSLGRARLYSAIHARIRKQSAERGSAFAIYGAWGSGKTHLLRYLESRLRAPFAEVEHDDPAVGEAGLYQGAYVVSRVLLWQYHTGAEAMGAMADAIFRAVSPAMWPSAAAPVPRLCIAFLCKLFGVEDELIRQALISLVGHGDAAETQIADINRYLAAQQRRAVLVIEDAERAELEVIEHLLPLLERLKRISSLTILCALDPDELQRKCETSGVVAGALQGYLDKIFDMGFAIPPIPEVLVDEYFSTYVAAHYADCPQLVAFAAKSELRFSTSRQVERVAARLASLEWMYLRFPRSRAEWRPISMLFYVEVLRCLYHGAYRELSVQDRPANLLYDYLRKPDDALRQKIPLSVSLMAQDRTFLSLARALAKDNVRFSVGVKMAMEGEYMRRPGLSESEMASVINIWAHTPESPVLSVVCSYLGVDSVERRECVENNLTAFALQQVLENTDLRGAAYTVLHSYLRRANRAYNLTTAEADYVPGLITRAISGNSLRALFLHRCIDASDTRCRELYELLADKLSFGDIADMHNLIRKVDKGMKATERTEATIRGIIESRDSSAFRAAADELAAYCCQRLPDYYLSLAEAGSAIPEVFSEEKLYFYESSCEERRRMARTLRRYLASASMTDRVKIFIGWVRMLSGWVFPKEKGPGGYRGVPLRRAHLLQPFLRAAAASPSFCRVLHAHLAVAEAPFLLCAIKRLEKECSAELYTQDYFREHRFAEGTQQIISLLKQLNLPDDNPT